jgi:hypothetical protein
MIRHPSRRRFLRTGAAVASIATTTALAGCQRALLQAVEDDRPESIESVRKWCPAPPDDEGGSELDSSDYYVFYRSPNTLTNVDNRTDNDLVRGSKRAFQERIAPLEVPYSDVPFTLDLGLRTQVVRYEHDPGEFVRTLEDSGFQEQPKHRAFRVYATVDGGDGESDSGSGWDDTVAFDGTHVVRSRHEWSPDTESTPWFERLIDAHAGAVDRYVDVDDHVKDMLEAANPGDILNLSRNEAISASDDTPDEAAFEGHVGQCLSGRFASSVAKFQLLFDFASIDDADRSAVKQYVEYQRDEGQGFLDAENIAYEDLGRMVEVTFQVPLEDL